MLATLESARKKLFASLAEEVLNFGEYKVGKGTKKKTVTAASNADFSNRASLEISNAVVESIVGRVWQLRFPGNP